MVVEKFNIKERGIFMKNINVKRRDNKVMEYKDNRTIKGTLRTIYFLIAEAGLACFLLLGFNTLKMEYNFVYGVLLAILSFPVFAGFVYYPLRKYASENLGFINAFVDGFISDLILIFSLLFFILIFKIPILKLS
jgi:F0F1-type ATP synthase assembly protein I